MSLTINGREWLTGVCRQGRGFKKKTHLFDGDFSDPGLPMCAKAWNKYGEYSIWRNNVSDVGYCKTCVKRATAGLKGMSFNEHTESTKKNCINCRYLEWVEDDSACPRSGFACAKRESLDLEKNIQSEDFRNRSKVCFRPKAKEET